MSKNNGTRDSLPTLKIEGREVEFLPISPLELAHLAADLTAAKLIGQPGPAGIPGQRRGVIAEAHDFFCLCADVVAVREKAIQLIKVREKSSEEMDRLRKIHGNFNPIPMAVVLKLLGLDRIKLRHDELQKIGITKKWETLSNDKRAGAVYLYLTREPIVQEDGQSIPMMDGRDHPLGSSRVPVGTLEERQKEAAEGLSLNRIRFVSEALLQAKQQRDSRLKSEAGKSSRRRPQRRSSQGTFAKAKRKRTGEFAPQGTD